MNIQTHDFLLFYSNFDTMLSHYWIQKLKLIDYGKFNLQNYFKNILKQRVPSSSTFYLIEMHLDLWHILTLAIIIGVEDVNKQTIN